MFLPMCFFCTRSWERWNVLDCLGVLPCGGTRKEVFPVRGRLEMTSASTGLSSPPRVILGKGALVDGGTTAFIPS